MRVVSVNVGTPRALEVDGKVILSGIAKSPVEGRVPARPHNLEGDRQANLSVHGGPDKAVYAYPVEHYAFWRATYPDADFSRPGTLGENLTVEGLLEPDVRIGDQLRIGTAVFRVTDPRLPCRKLANHVGKNDIQKRFTHALRTGWYMAIVESGEVCAGDEITRVARGSTAVTVEEIVRLYAIDKHDAGGLRRAIEVPELPEGTKETFRKRLEAIEGRASG